MQGCHSVKEVRSWFVVTEQEWSLTGLDVSAAGLLHNHALANFRFTQEQSCRCSPMCSGHSHHISAGFASTRAGWKALKHIEESNFACSQLTGLVQEKIVDDTKVRSGVVRIDA